MPANIICAPDYDLTEWHLAWSRMPQGIRNALDIDVVLGLDTMPAGCFDPLAEALNYDPIDLGYYGPCAYWAGQLPLDCESLYCDISIFDFYDNWNDIIAGTSLVESLQRLANAS